MSTPSYTIRDRLPEDDGFLARCWVDTARGSARVMRRVDSARFTKSHYAYAERMLPVAQARVAAPEGDDVTIYGFSLWQGETIHLVYVKKAWRGLGIARALTKALDLQTGAFSTMSVDMSRWGLEKWPGLTYSPYWLSTDWKLCA